jgi:uncharacterized protein YcfJ
MLAGIVAGAIGATAIGGSRATGRLIPSRALPKCSRQTRSSRRAKCPKRCAKTSRPEKAPVKDPNRIAGTAISAVAGGLVGSQIGGGGGRKLSTIAGAAADGYAGNQVQKNLQENNTARRTETRCRTVYESRSKTVGYDGRYRLGDDEGVVRTSRPPGAHSGQGRRVATRRVGKLRSAGARLSAPLATATDRRHPGSGDRRGC